MAEFDRQKLEKKDGEVWVPVYSGPSLVEHHFGMDTPPALTVNEPTRMATDDVKTVPTQETLELKAKQEMYDLLYLIGETDSPVDLLGRAGAS